MPHQMPGGPRKLPPPVSEHAFLNRAAGLPPSFFREGFIPSADIVKFNRLMIGIDGPSDSGKTEFGLSAPGPGLAICLDRGIDGALQNPAPPTGRSKNWGFKVISAPLPTQAVQRDYQSYYTDFYTWYKKACENADARSVIIDGDSDSWELQRLAEFGKLTQIPSIMYTNVNAARRAMYARAWDSNKIFIFTNKVKAEYIDDVDAQGVAKLGNDGKPLRKKSGDYERQGFPDQDYLFHIQLRTMVEDVDDKGKPLPGGRRYGIKIMKCKSNHSLVGMDLWGEDCNFAGLVQTVYPEVPLEKWGL